MNSMNSILSITLVLAAAWAVVTDCQHRRIPNWLTFGAAGIAVAVRLVMGGSQAALDGGKGWLVGVALFSIPFIFGWMGAGDIKLLAAFGALGGPIFVIQTTIASCLVGGVMSLFYLMKEGKLLFFLRHIFIFLRYPFGTVLKSKRRMPFGPALAAGAVASLVMARGVL